ncbi:MAG TPA: hypothetical protein PKV67_02850 [Hyphomonas sp.]|nr:hypothetical protein [Hyphomonas sp.]HRI99686.1 hypothetical protein [Hyphomonas sp.]HRK67052.1 hypothetical protein [Hyphomonas sp.]
MRKFIVAAAIIALSFPALGQGNPAPADSYTPASVSALAQRALDACPDLMSRTSAAIENGHVSYLYDYDCDCMARSIDYASWDESNASYSGPKMPESDAFIIIGALASAPTIEDAFSEIDENISDTGFAVTSACYEK